MKKQEIKEKILEMFAKNEPLDEETVSEQHESFYNATIETYGDWEKALRRNGITHKKKKEREKFILYWIMKRRYEKFGDEALRPKNIDEHTKQRIAEQFKTIKVIQELVKTWNYDRIIYELRAMILSGTPFDEIENAYPELYHQIHAFYGSMDKVIKEYNERFGTSYFEEDREEQEVEAVPGTVEIINTIVQLGIMSEKQAQAVLDSKKITKDEIRTFLLDEVSNAWKSGTQISQERIERTNPAIYYAIKAEYGGLQEAFDEVMRSAFVIEN